MFKQIRESRWTRIFCFFMAINILAELISPNVAMALTSGPSQPEVQSFEPVNTSEMVDLFSGDFKYNIPLMDVDGYPINICYNSGVTMDQEASWVGLGWNLNVGAINRTMRGLPDDFNGEDIVSKEFNMKDNITYGGHVKVGFEVFGWGGSGATSSGSGGFSIGLGIRYNNYTGFASEYSMGMSLNAGNASKGNMNAGLGLTSSADEGLNISPSVSFSSKINGTEKGESSCTVGGGVSMGYNSRSGMKSLSFNTNVSPGQKSYTRSGINPNNNQVETYTGSGGASGLGYSSGFTVSFADPTYVPQIDYPMLNSSISIGVKLGGHVFGLDATLDLGGYYSKQRLATKNIYSPAYGYLYSHMGQLNEKAMLDFNREKDGGFSPGMELLPVTNTTYDVYSIMGQGIGGTFRPYRSDVGHVFDPKTENISDSYSIGTEVAAGNLVKVGTDIGVVDVHSTSGKWEDDNSAWNKLMYSGADKLGEPAYFKEVGERTVDSDPSRFGNVGEFDPVRVKLDGPAMFAKAGTDLEKQDLSNGNISSYGMPSSFFRGAREKRNKVISSLTLAEAKNFGLETTRYSAMPSGAKDHHVAEITVLSPDGRRYIYGQPVYNHTQEEVSFNASGNSFASNKDYATGLVNYSSGSDDSKSNSKGVDNFYTRTTLPAYPYSYMLTAIVSPDYVDINSNGPDAADLGDYTAFSYTNVVNNYEWRSPVGSGKANYNENTKLARPGDDYGNYVWGKKDIYYINKIETKNYTAVFTTGNRQDGYQVTKTGAKNSTNIMQLLKKITLYTKKEFDASPTTAIPIKSVNFVYDYSLCTLSGFSSGIDDVPNNSGSTPGSFPTANELTNDGGKLTLKQLYFTYGTSEKAKFSKYEFEYNPTNNPAYDPKAYDRWGNYKPNAAAVSSNPAADCAAIGGILPNWEFPYSEQDKTNEDLYASSWSLTKINLPSGAEINIDYESDDYAYVQNLPAMDMFKVTGIGADPASIGTEGGDDPNQSTGTIMDLMSASSGSSPGSPNLYIYFKLDTLINGTLSPPQAAAFFKDHYLKDMINGRYMYFRFLMNLTRTGTPSASANLGNYFEYISGYAEIDDNNCGVIKDGSTEYNYGYIKLSTVDIGKNPSSANVHPICKATWQTGRTQYSQLVWDADFTPSGGADDVVKSLVSSNITKTILGMFSGPNMALAKKDYGKQCVVGKSWIRLYDPNGKKLGGGSRVKKLTIKDNWYTMTGNHQNEFDYGQQYEYTMTENGETISSGVASYEPMIGNDENPFRLPNYYRNQGNNPLKNTFLINDDRFYKEEPYGESFFPAPGIGYSNVKVMDLVRTNGEPYPYTTVLVNAHATGFVIHKFYTAKDYPTLTYRTKLEKKIFKPAIASLLKIASRDYMTTSQGYVIELNDMHGKPKAVETYAQGKPNQPISKIEYFYKTEGANGYEEPSSVDKYNDAKLKANRLSNECSIIRTDGSVGTEQIGVDYDMVSDFRENKTSTVTGGIQANVSVFLVGYIPAVSVTIWPDFSYDETRFRSAVVTKVINRYGLLEKTVATDLGSRIETKNLAYDSETGEVLLTQTFNEFNDPIYSFNYPAHWAYGLMGQAYKNIGANFTNVPVTSSVGNVTSAANYFAVGDELMLRNCTTSVYSKAWVCSVGTPLSNNFTLIDENGALLPGTVNYDIKVLRSGRRNQQVLPIGSVVSLVNPIATSSLTFDKVTKTSAVQFSDQWQMHRGHDPDPSDECCELNGYALAIYNLMDALSQAGNSAFLASIGSPTQIYDGLGNYSYGFTSIINNVPASSAASWFLLSNSPANEAQFDLGDASGAYDCIITAILPPSMSWAANTYTFTSVSPVISSCSFQGMKICANYKNISTLATGSTCFTVTAGCWDLGTCKETNSGAAACAPKEGDVVNPFFKGIKGNWRTQKSWAYLAPRYQTSATNANTDIRKDGYFYDPATSLSAYSPFWVYSGGAFGPNTSSWTFASEVTKYNTNGTEVENKDALGRYSSAVYGYNETLPIAVASNAKYNEVAYDGFEDYNYKNSADCRKSHFNFYEYSSKLSTSESHTGTYSIKLAPGAILSNKRTILTPCTTAYSSNCNYGLVCNDFLGQFSPVNSTGSPQKYILSYWVKENLYSPSFTVPYLSYMQSAIQISIKPTSGPTTVLTASNVKRSSLIDGWQRVEYTFNVPASTTSGDIIVSLMNNSPAAGPSKCDVFFDDIRIHPFSSNIKTFVYNPKNLRYVAELDANNFATFYEYNEEGSLIRTKKETEKGIMTLKESKNHIKR